MGWFRSGKSTDSEQGAAAPDARWRPLASQYSEHFRRSLTAIHLHDWLQDPERYRAMLGPDVYRGHMARILADATPEDCAAAGMEVDSNLAYAEFAHRFFFQVSFAPGGAHRAVLWREHDWDGTLGWVDGRPLSVNGTAIEVDAPGRWANERYFAIAVAGPSDHPDQGLAGIGSPLGAVQSLLIWDAGEGRLQSIQVPGPEQRWSAPWAEVAGSELRIFSSDRSDPSHPDRMLAIESSTP